MLLMETLKLFAKENSVDNLTDCLNQHAEETNMSYNQFNRLSKAIYSFNLQREGFTGSHLHLVEDTNSCEQEEPNKHEVEDDFEDEDFEDEEEEDEDDELLEEESEEEKSLESIS